MYYIFKFLNQNILKTVSCMLNSKINFYIKFQVSTIIYFCLQLNKNIVNTNVNNDCTMPCK